MVRSILLTIALALTSASASAQVAYFSNPNDNTVTVLGTANDTILATLSGFTRPQSVATSADGATVYVANKPNSAPYPFGFISVINTAANTVSATIGVGARPSGIVLSPDGTKLYVSNMESGGAGTVSVINTSSNSVVATIDAQRTIAVGGTPQALAITPDGFKVLVSSNTDDKIFVIETINNTVIRTIILPSGSSPVGIVISQDGSRDYVANSSTDKISVISLTDPNYGIIADISSCPVPINLSLTPNGLSLYATCYGLLNQAGSAAVYSTTSFALIASVNLGLGSNYLYFTPDGTKAYVTNLFDGTVSVINTGTVTILRTIVLGAGPTPIPTLSQWAMILLGLILAGGAAVMIHQRPVISR